MNNLVIQLPCVGVNYILVAQQLQVVIVPIDVWELRRELQRDGEMEIQRYREDRETEIQRDGDIEIQRCRDIVIQRYRYMEIQKYKDIELYRYRDIEIQTYQIDKDIEIHIILNNY